MLALEASGQPGFNRLYGFEQDFIGNVFLNVLRDSDTIVLFGGGTPTFPPYLQGLLFAKLDTQGNVLFQKYYPDPDGEEYGANLNFDLIKTSDNGYGLTGVALQSNSGVFVKLTQDGEIEFYKKYDPSPGLQYQPRKILETPGGFLLCGFKSMQNYDIQVFLMKTDKQGNFLWEKTYGEPGVLDAPSSLIKTDDNLYTMGIVKAKGLGEPPFSTSDTWTKGWLLQVDSTGNVVTSYESTLNKNIGIGGLKRMPDGWLFGSVDFELQSPFAWGSRSKIVRTGEDIKDVIWERYVSPTTFAGNTVFDIKPTPDGHWVSVGQWITPIPASPDDPPNFQGGSTFKFSSEGDSIWARLDTAFYHPVCGSTSHLGGVAVLPDGSVVAAGYANSYCFPLVRSWAWVIKIDPDGCIDTLACFPVTTPAGEAESALPALSAFPNPATDYVDFRLSGTVPGGSTVLTVSDLGGRPVWSAAVRFGEAAVRWETGNLPSGLYFYRLTRDGEVVGAGKVVLVK